jgi:hypothetical protein
MSARVWRIFVIALWSVREILTVAWSFVRAPVILVLQILAALIVLFEEWGWKPLSEALAQLAKYAPIAALERWIARLPPYGALAVFAVPMALLFPLKLVAVWLLAQGRAGSATALFISVKLTSTALLARIFTLTKPALMQIEWFARGYNWFVPWKDALFTTIRESFTWRYGRMLKTRVVLEAKQAWARWRAAGPETVPGRITAAAAGIAETVRKRLYGQ